jgi:hypothetical protein
MMKTGEEEDVRLSQLGRQAREARNPMARLNNSCSISYADYRFRACGPYHPILVFLYSIVVFLDTCATFCFFKFEYSIYLRIIYIALNELFHEPNRAIAGTAGLSRGAYS